MSRDSLATMLDFTRRTTELTADEVREIDGGWVVSTPSLSVAWGVNHVRLASAISFADALAIADEAQADLGYRQVVLEGDAVNPETEAAFSAAGWKAERDLLMELVNPSDREVDTGSVVETDEDAQLELGRLWTLEEAPQTKPEDMTRLLEFWRREARARGDRGLGIASAAGRGIAAKAKLRSDGSTAQVEDVYTVPEARGRGYARALITRAIELAKAEEHELIFIIADDDGWPKQLYRRIGFEPVGRVLHFHRDLANGDQGSGTAARKPTATNPR
jgi:GNAT superfamily N-acetyltransferase